MLYANCLRSAALFAGVCGLAACSENPLPSTPISSAPAPAVVQPAPAVVALPPGTIVTQPGTVAVLPGSGSSTVTAVPARLSAPEVMALIDGSTASGTSNLGRPYYVKFLRDGRLEYRDNTYNNTYGTWRVAGDGQLCSSFNKINAGIEQCYFLYRNGANYVYERPDGHPVGEFTVTPGA